MKAIFEIDKFNVKDIITTSGFNVGEQGQGGGNTQDGNSGFLSNVDINSN